MCILEYTIARQRVYAYKYTRICLTVIISDLPAHGRNLLYQVLAQLLRVLLGQAIYYTCMYIYVCYMYIVYTSHTYTKKYGYI